MPLETFLPFIRRWFEETFGEPTRPQREGWASIAGGAHLALALERLAALAGDGIQRIGCSATVRPVEEALRFLVGAGRSGVTVDAGFSRDVDLEVVTPVADFLRAQSDTVWDALIQQIAEWVTAHRTTLVFAPSRRSAERLARNLAERLPDGGVMAHHGSLSRRARLDAEDRLKRGELVEAAAIGRAIRERQLDRQAMPDAPLDVLAQQIVACVAAAGSSR